MTENWLAGFANYESWIGDSENEGSPDLDRVFADAHDFQMARAAEAAQVSASNPPAPRPDPAITGPEDLAVVTGGLFLGASPLLTHHT